MAQLSGPVRSFLATEAGSAGLLLAAVVVALVWANSPWSDAYTALWATEASVSLGGADLSMDLGHWVSDGLMALFFFVVGLEVRYQASAGELTGRRSVVLPALAGTGGMLVPALLYLAVVPGGEARGGWGVVIGTDTAFMLGALAVVGPRFVTQLRVFLLAVTVLDDIVAVTVIGVVYSGTVRPVPLLAALVLCALLAGLSRLRVWRTAPYVLVALALWCATFASGLHASVAGMIGGLLIPARAPTRELVEKAAGLFRAFRQSPRPDVGRTARMGLQRAVSVNERLQTVLHPWTSYVVVPVFALASAGIDLRGGVLAEALSSAVTWAVVIGLVVGKLLGIALGAFLGIRLGLGRLPQGVGPGQVLGGAALSGIGFTVSLLIAGLAFEDPSLRTRATVGVLLAALLSALLGWVVFHLAAVLRGETEADLPRFLDRPVDPATDHVTGPPDAPLTLVEYGDFECPFCARATGVAQELRQRFGDRLRYVFRHLPLLDVHPHSELAARAAVAADAQGRFWQMHDLLFAHQDQLEFEDILGYAGQIGLDVERFLEDLDSERTAARVRADVASAEASGARGTPTFFLGSRRHTGPYDAQTLARELETSAADSHLP
ncbi:Na+/H+ antiporter NhaA [Streptomyces viridosporus ATCC 14672]|uniref:Na(+)/H(+) antiporter NhaA n=1 Tax=Streptomyces viridosporus (strain ATCC 14672 / DSM 40746 / JCM 4963 / KCTC 9882 / NRRL B-12104 / FH 1290) TaxID=566461 RepID=D5ZYC9_STRV1|nr:Na+/H+ antiporter NhaA [Streptomyces viridosporus]EFE71127.1 Na+/H+ antiporter NhaA [Streptomyces viridosporus ATCC 14672]